MMACDVEYALLNIIAYSTPDPKNQIRKFKDMRMKGKIECAISDLKKYKPAYYDEYKDHLDALDSFRLWRNDFAHLKMGFPNKQSLDEFEMILVDEEGGIEGLKFKKYTIAEFLDGLNKFKIIEKGLVKLWKKLKSDYDPGKWHPLIHPNADS
jgi:hypothetical protein